MPELRSKGWWGFLREGREQDRKAPAFVQHEGYLPSRARIGSYSSHCASADPTRFPREEGAWDGQVRLLFIRTRHS